MVALISSSRKCLVLQKIKWTYRDLKYNTLRRFCFIQVSGVCKGIGLITIGEKNADGNVWGKHLRKVHINRWGDGRIRIIKLVLM
jgi:hypothetical protein